MFGACHVCSTGRHTLPLSLPVLAVLVFPLLAGVVAMSADATGPAFAEGQHTHVAATTGSSTHLECSVLRLGGRTVSWVRVRDVLILAHSGVVFASDTRLSAALLEDVNGGATRHKLSITGVRIADTGRYECQLNTDPKMSLFFDLTVYEENLRQLKVRLSGPAERRVNLGDTLTLECEAQDEAVDALDVDVDLHWLHDDQPLTPHSDAGVWLETQRWPRRAVSHLTVSRLSMVDIGLYTCRAGDAVAHVRILIHNSDHDYGEHSEAMQRDQEMSVPGRATAVLTPAAAALALLVAAGAA